MKMNWFVCCLIDLQLVLISRGALSWLTGEKEEERESSRPARRLAAPLVARVRVCVPRAPETAGVDAARASCSCDHCSPRCRPRCAHVGWRCEVRRVGCARCHWLFLALTHRCAFASASRLQLLIVPPPPHRHHCPPAPLPPARRPTPPPRHPLPVGHSRGARPSFPLSPWRRTCSPSSTRCS